MNEKILVGVRFALSVAMIGFGCWVYGQMKPQQFATYETGINQPDAAFDAILRGILRTHGDVPQLQSRARPTDALRQAIKQLSGESLLFVVNFKDPNRELGQFPGHALIHTVASILAWPRIVNNPSCGDKVYGETLPHTFKASGAIYYHTTPPSNLKTQRTFLPEMIVVTTPEPVQWNTFCQP